MGAKGKTGQNRVFLSQVGGHVVCAHAVAVDQQVSEQTIKPFAHSTILQNLNHPQREPWHAPK